MKFFIAQLVTETNTFATAPTGRWITRQATYRDARP